MKTLVSNVIGSYLKTITAPALLNKETVKIFNNFDLPMATKFSFCVLSCRSNRDFQSFSNHIYFRSSRDTDVESEQSLLRVQFINS